MGNNTGFLCLVEGCRIKARWAMHGRCRRHFEEWKTTLGGKLPLPPTPADRFWSKVDCSEDNVCWPWLGALNRYGYGHLNSDLYGTAQAHRFAYEDRVGPIPSGMQLDHLCHTDSDCMLGNRCPHRRCVNPLHLEVVTPAENTRRGHFLPPALVVPQGAVCA